MKDWEDVVATALSLPGVELSTSYGEPALKVRGKTIAALTGPDGSFVLHLPQDEKQVLIDTDPDTFWQTPHYDGWAAVLVRYGTPACERIATLIERSWWDRATQAQRGDRSRP